MKKALIIGYGSIGKKHTQALDELNLKINLVTKQSIQEFKTFTDINLVHDINSYDYFVIASSSELHLEQLHFLDKTVSNKTILCEKPLFLKNYLSFNPSKKNKIFVGYNLRFYDGLVKLKSYIDKEEIYFASCEVGQYLPKWREDRNYALTYSASKEKGGGVLLDLSHELDYIQWFFGPIKSYLGYVGKVSSLKINTEDLVVGVLRCIQNIPININLNYISSHTVRSFCIHTNKGYYLLDFIKSELLIHYYNSDPKIIKFERHPKDSYKIMHSELLNNNFSNFCTLKEGINTLKVIDMINEKGVGYV